MTALKRVIVSIYKNKIMNCRYKRETIIQEYIKSDLSDLDINYRVVITRDENNEESKRFFLNTLTKLTTSLFI